MSSLDVADQARVWAEALEDHAADRDGVSIIVARPLVARELGVSPGTLENLRKRRLKAVPARLYLALQRATLRRLRSELRRIQHEIEIIEAQGGDLAADQLAEALADRAAIRRALGLPE